MELISVKETDDKTVVYLKGRVDSSNAPNVEAEIFSLGEALKGKPVVLDVENLEYISSAGLRIILKLLKENSALKIVNASSETYDIFEMTGFTEMVQVEKAYRKLSVDGCEVIGEGANGKVYRLDPDTIIKVYLNPDSLPDIQRERELARRAFVLGIPTAIPYDVVKVGDGYGSVFELLNADSFANLIKASPEKLDEIIGLYVELMKKIHSTEVKKEDMPDMREVVLGWAKFVKEYLPKDKGEKLVSLVEAVPVKHFMLHGDYHIKNVMMQNGEVLLIDMDTLCQGHPVFELASVYNAYVGFYEYNQNVEKTFLGLSLELSKTIWEKTLKAYLNTSDESKIRAVEKKAMLVGDTRLMRRLIRRNALETEEGRAEVETYKNHILSLLDEVDGLEF